MNTCIETNFKGDWLSCNYWFRYKFYLQPFKLSIMF